MNEGEGSRYDHEVDWVRCSNENYNQTGYEPKFKCSTTLRAGCSVVLQDANVTYDPYYPPLKGDQDPSDLIVKDSQRLTYSFKGIDIDALLNNQKLLDPTVIFGCCFSSFGVVFSAFLLFAFLSGSQAKRTNSTETLTDQEDSTQPNHRRSSAFLQNVSTNIVRLKTQTSSLGRSDESGLSRLS